MTLTPVPVSGQHLVGILGRVVLTGGLLLYTLVVSVGAYWRGFSTATTVLVALGLCLPWLVSTSKPRLCFVVMALAAVVQVMAGIGAIPADLMLFIGIYALAVHARRHVAQAAALAVAIGACVAAIRRQETFASTAVPLLMIFMVTVTICLWGNHTALKRMYERTLIGRVEQLQREQRHLVQIAAADERTRIARDLHDVISHSMSGILTLSEGTLRTSPELAETHRDSLRLIASTCRHSLNEFRHLFNLLRDESAEPTRSSPTVENIEFLVAAMRSKTVDSRLIVSGHRSHWPAGVQETLYRIVQESLTNIQKHAGPSVTTVTTEIVITAVRVDLHVLDDGVGSANYMSHCSVGTDGFGLQGMRERVDALNGTLFTGAAPNGGFVVRATIPVDRLS